jgi:hypothetical protein
MNHSHRTLPTIGAIILSALLNAFIFGSFYIDWPPPPAKKEQPAQSIQTDPNDAGEAFVLRDINSYAMRHIGAVEDDIESFGSTDHWSERWRLYWMDVRHQEGTSRIYHVIDLEHPQVRFTTMWNGSEAHWERAY